MNLILTLDPNISIIIDGKISQIDYNWKIKPIVKILNNFKYTTEDLDLLFSGLKKIKDSTLQKLKIKSNFFFKAAFFFFCKMNK